MVLSLIAVYFSVSFQAAINEANALTKISPALKTEKDEYIYRSYLGLGQYHVILSEINENPNTSVGQSDANVSPLCRNFLVLH